MAAQEENLQKQQQKQNEIQQPTTIPTINLPEVPQHIPITLPSAPTNEINVKTAELSA